VRFLVDENLSPRVADLLAKAGHDAVHVRGLHAAGAPDSAVMTIAADDDRVILAADTDFGALLAQVRSTRPSVILVREVMGLRPADLVSLVLEQLMFLRRTWRSARSRRLPRRGSGSEHSHCAEGWACG
jgi:predicted nuclease of predicted toxin-antitoxin system